MTKDTRGTPEELRRAKYGPTLSEQRRAIKLTAQVVKNWVEVNKKIELKKRAMTKKEIKRYGALRHKAIQGKQSLLYRETDELNALGKKYIEYLQAGNEPAFELNPNTIKQRMRDDDFKWKTINFRRKRGNKGSEDSSYEFELPPGPG